MGFFCFLCPWKIECVEVMTGYWIEQIQQPDLIGKREKTIT